MDKTKSGQETSSAIPSSAEDTARVGFCQECGRPLTRATLQRRDDGVFCQTCVTGTTPHAGWQRVHAGPRPGPAHMSSAVPPRRTDEPNPAVAACLGFIPGVGAMFNGQYAKSAMHLIVFVILVALADNLYWAFWWLVWGWIFYQAFDAYHTAQARRDHLPLPNPFGWNDMGEQMGLGPSVPPQVGAVPPRAASDSAQPPTIPPQVATSYQVNQSSWEAAATWEAYAPQGWMGTPQPASTASAGDNPYSAPYTAPLPPPPTTPGQGPTSVPYVPTYTGSAPVAPGVSTPQFVGTRRFPLGALWLIGLGFVFLTGNLLPAWRLSAHWFAPLLLAALAFWNAFRRWEIARLAQVATGLPLHLAQVLMFPAVLLTVAALLALQSAAILPMRRSWPMLLVVWGMMLLVQRSSASTPLPLPGPENASAAPPPPVRSTAGTGSLGL